ncbi:transient receptor potential cation channel subfamily a member 1-like [Gigaspora margarita]|uniref:Transient receptor potential cation channel subfamily a member 1-like n=1 Tax=Gigaspora margarita TaxID=4874 RepID=A0A8H3ZYN6_GIGMA|nr:transient receptor potential cation channel subfamily a member 1-like [Gigaspora margarita]
MTSNSDVKITIEEAPDKNKILEIVCSPNMKHAATLDVANNISFWTTINQDQLLEKVKTVCIDNIRINENGEKIFAISNNKCISISLYRVDPYNFKIFDFETEKEISLNFPDWQKEIDFLSFIDGGSIILVNARYYRAYIFSNKEKDNNITWDCKSRIELKYFKKINITPKGKLIIFNDTIYEITMWDIEKLSANTRILIEWSCTPEFIEISDDEKLLFVCTKDKKTKETSVFAFSTETEINISSFSTPNLEIDKLHLIASKKGERLLYRCINKSGKYNFNLMDPYNLKNPINVTSKLFEKKQYQEAYIIKSDKIIYTNDGNVLIEKLVSDNWIEYLRKDLKDTNSITVPSEKTIDIIIKFIKNTSTDVYNVDKAEFEGKFLKWGLELDDKLVRLTVADYNFRQKKWNDAKKQLDIIPSFCPYGKNFILNCEVLENDDFITFTRIGIIIWTYKIYGIKMHYFWNDWNDHLEKFDFKFNALLGRLNGWTSGRILPASSYKTVYKNLYVKFGESELFKEFLKNDKWVRNLGGKCMDHCMDKKNNNHLISKISLLNIIFENFNDLSESHPAFIASTLASIGLVVPSTIVIPNSMSSHLSCYGSYYNLSKSFFDRLISDLWVCWISYKKIFQKFQEWCPLFCIVKPIINSYFVGNSSIILAIPLPNFVSYPKKYNFWKELILPSPNPFTHSNKVDVINEEFYRYLNGEALLKFKWNAYGRYYYLTAWAIYTVFLLSFVIAATYYKTISQTSLFILLKITICLGIWHLFFGLRQFIYAPLNYLTSAWNFFDLGAFLLPMISSILWLQNKNLPTEWATFSTLLLEIKFLLYFRAIEFSGSYFSMILGVAQRGFSFLIILGFIVFAFAHSLHLLLRPTIDVSLDYPSYSNDPNDPWNLATTYNNIDPNGTIEVNSSLIEPPTATTNMFMLMGSAIAAVYIMLTGDTSPISYWDLDNNRTLLILTIIFSFVTTIYLMNLFIGLLSNEISNTKTRELFLILRAEILEEIELLYMLHHQRRKENWFPFVIFYECQTVKLREHVMDIQKDKWLGYRKPYISKNLYNVLHLPDEPPSLEQVVIDIKNLKESMKILTKKS